MTEAWVLGLSTRSGWVSGHCLFCYHLIIYNTVCLISPLRQTYPWRIMRRGGILLNCSLKKLFLDAKEKWFLLSYESQVISGFSIRKKMQLNNIEHRIQTLYGEGSILSPNNTWPRFSDGRFPSFAWQKSNLGERIFKFLNTKGNNEITNP